MTFLPIFLNIHDKSCLVVGGGTTATRKVELLLQANAKVIVVAPDLTEQLSEWRHEGRIIHRANHFVPTDIQSCHLVIAATNDKAVNEEISKLAKGQRILVNVVDHPELCSFIMPSIIDRSPVQIAVSTGGASPVLARLLRARLESMIPATYGKLAEFVASFRDKVKQRLSFDERRQFWEDVLQGPIAEMLLSGHTKAATQALENLIDKTVVEQKYGEVYLVGGGPGVVAAHAQIKQHSGGNNGHPGHACIKAITMVTQPAHHAGGRVQPEGRAAGEKNAMHLLHQIFGTQEVGLTGARRGPAHIHRRSRALGREDDSAAGAGLFVGVMPDQNAGNGSDGIV